MFSFGGGLLKVKWDLLRCVSCSLRRPRGIEGYGPGLWDSPLLCANEDMSVVHFVQQELFLDVANHCVPDSHLLWKAEESQAVLCMSWLSTLPAPLGCGALAGVSLLSAASDGDTHRTAVVSHNAAWWVLATVLWCLRMSVPQEVILGIMKVGSILSQKPILICIMLVR